MSYCLFHYLSIFKEKYYMESDLEYTQFSDLKYFYSYVV